MSPFTIATIAALSLVSSGVMIGLKLPQAPDAQASKPPLLKLGNKQPLALRLGNDGCIVTDEHRKSLRIENVDGNEWVIPKGARFTGPCFSFE